MITTKNVQTLKIGESSYIILFLTQIFSKCLYWEVQHSWLVESENSVRHGNYYRRCPQQMWSKTLLTKSPLGRGGVVNRGMDDFGYRVQWYELRLCWIHIMSLKDLRLDVYMWMVVYSLDEKALEMLVSISGMSWNCSWGSLSCIDQISLLTIIRAREEQVAT